jgi:alpha-ketoglutarate-dependent taurine dioxygenase
MKQAINAADLQELGWAVGHLSPNPQHQYHDQILELAVRFGKIAHQSNASPVTVLQPQNKQIAKPNTLSAKFSTGEFPYHTDTAHWPIPARYMILACIDPGAGSRETHLLDSTKLELTASECNLLNSTPFRIVNGRKSFFSTILQKNRSFIRHDPGCMVPTEERGEVAQKMFCRDRFDSLVVPIKWEPQKVLIIDNWRFLHGRSKSICNDSNRKLLRVYIRGDN